MYTSCEACHRQRLVNSLTQQVQRARTQLEEARTDDQIRSISIKYYQLTEHLQAEAYGLELFLKSKRRR